MTPEEKARSGDLHEAIAKVLGEHADHESDRGLLVGWVLVAEAVGDDGEPWLRMIHNEESTQWRRLGLIEFARQTQNAVIASTILAREGDDE